MVYVKADKTGKTVVHRILPTTLPMKCTLRNDFYWLFKILHIHKTFRKRNHQTSIINTIVLLFFPGSLARYPTLISLRRPSTARLEASWTPWRSALYGDDRFRFTYSVTSLLRTSKGPSCELGRGQSENRIPGLPAHGFSHIIFYCTSEAKPYRDLHSVIVNQY